MSCKIPLIDFNSTGAANPSCILNISKHVQLLWAISVQFISHFIRIWIKRINCCLGNKNCHTTYFLSMKSPLYSHTSNAKQIWSVRVYTVVLTCQRHPCLFDCTVLHRDITAYIHRSTLTQMHGSARYEACVFNLYKVNAGKKNWNRRLRCVGSRGCANVLGRSCRAVSKKNIYFFLNRYQKIVL